MDISAEEVLHLAKLARLDLEPAEVKALRRDLAAILEYVDQLQKLDTGDVPATAHVLDIETPLRTDVVGNRLSVAEAVRNAPQHDDSAMIVPKVIE